MHRAERKNKHTNGYIKMDSIFLRVSKFGIDTRIDNCSCVFTIATVCIKPILTCLVERKATLPFVNSLAFENRTRY